MKTRKTVTQKVLTANRNNAKRSTGPRDVRAVRQNARKHGLLAKHLIFQNEDEAREFEELVKEIEADQNPSSQLERTLVEEAAVSIWKIRITDSGDIAALMNRRRTAKAVLQRVAENNNDERLLFNSSMDDDAAQRVWDCEELVLKTGSRNAEHQPESLDTRTASSGQVQIEAKLTTSLDTLLRYRSSIKRDLYRAIAALREMRRDRN